MCGRAIAKQCQQILHSTDTHAYSIHLTTCREIIYTLFNVPYITHDIHCSMHHKCPNPVMPTLLLLAGDLRFFVSSPALPLWYINLPLFTSTIKLILNTQKKIKQTSFEIQPIFRSKLECFLFAVRFLGHFCTYLLIDKDYFLASKFDSMYIM